MTIFLGIGVSHVDEVSDFVYGVLDRFKPQAITLENRMSFTNVHESTALAPRREKRFYRKKCEIRYEFDRGDVEIIEMKSGYNHHENIKKVRLYLDDLCVLDGNRLEFNPTIAYALRNNIPFYFIDAPLLDKSIIEFRSDNYEIISLENETRLTKKISSESIPFMRDDLTRNKFAADAINFLYRKGENCVAHVGGTGHFNAQYLITDSWDPYPQDYKSHIQDFVKATDVFVADSNSGIVHKLK